jgi:hypothetical protein
MRERMNACTCDCVSLCTCDCVHICTQIKVREFEQDVKFFLENVVNVCISARVIFGTSMLVTV